MNFEMNVRKKCYLPFATEEGFPPEVISLFNGKCDLRLTEICLK